MFTVTEQIIVIMAQKVVTLTIFACQVDASTYALTDFYCQNYSSRQL